MKQQLYTIYATMFLLSLIDCKQPAGMANAVKMHSRTHTLTGGHLIHDTLSQCDMHTH